MKKVFMFFAVLLCAVTTFGQSYSVSQNQQNININVPVIEKEVYIERYREAEEPEREAFKLSEPVQLYGYLWVYTEDIGNFKRQSDAVQVINSINRQNPYGKSNWRIPTDAELAVLENNADEIGLGDDIYLSMGHANGVLRMVSTDDIEAEKFVDLGLSVRWAKCNMGAASPEKYGTYYNQPDACLLKGLNGRTPTSDEINELRVNCVWTWTSQNGVNGYKVTGPNGNNIFLPAAGYRYNNRNEYSYVGSYGYYWSTKNKDEYNGYSYKDWYGYYLTFGSTSNTESKTSDYKGYQYQVRPVKE